MTVPLVVLAIPAAHRRVRFFRARISCRCRNDEAIALSRPGLALAALLLGGVTRVLIFIATRETEPLDIALLRQPFLFR